MILPSCKSASLTGGKHSREMPDPLTELEERIRAAGHTLERTFDRNEGWKVFVRNEVVARGQSIGQLQRELEAWWRKQKLAEQLERESDGRD